MKFNQISSKLPSLIQKQDKNEQELSKKIEPTIKLRPTETNLAPFKSLYDSGWTNITPENIAGATTQVEDLELPQRVPFEFTTNLEVSDFYLPFINVAILTKPVDEQKVIGAGAFVYSGLREVVIDVYNWQGTTQANAAHPTQIRTDNTYALPGLPTPTIEMPFAVDCYTRITYYNYAYFMGPYAEYQFWLTPDGLMSQAPTTPGIVFADWAANFTAPIPPDIYRAYSVLWYFSQSVTFNYPATFPVPLDGKSELPCGSTTYREDGQYWELQGHFTFSEYMSRFNVSYADAKEIFDQFYPDLFITPEENNPPYKAYARFNSDVVESGNLKTKIVKTNNTNFQFSVYGDILLVSPANKEVDFSDEDYPTFQPDADPLDVKLLITFKEHPVNSIQTEKVRQ
jgi:hypothetical protein